MRLLQAMAGAKHGGAEAFFERLAIAFAEDGVPQRVVIRPDAAREARLGASGVTVSTLPFGGFFDLTTGRGLARLANDADLLLTWMNRATRFARPTPRTRLVARLGGYYDLKYYRRCEYLVANTEDICRWLRGQGFPPDRVTYLPNFVEPQAVAPLSRETLSDRDGPLLLMLGRLHANKAFDVALAALPDIPKANLLIAGVGPEQEKLFAQAKRLDVADRVRFLGWRDDGAALLASVDALLVPSRHEPLGNVVLEGWAQRCPVIAASSAGPASLIEDGVSGRLVPVDDSAALARAVRETLALLDRGRGFAEAGFATLQQNFSKAAVVARYRAFFEQVCSSA